jgi:YbbR domain-containing protein
MMRLHLPFQVDIGRAIFAVALAVLLYFVAVSETNPADQRETSFSVQVQVVNVQAGLVNITSPPPVRLWVTAPQNVFSRLRPESFTAQVDASTAHSGDNDLPIAVTTSDPEVRSVQPEQATLRLTLEEVTHQVLPVRVNVAGQPPSGYRQQGAANWDPTQITIEGPASLVSRATAAQVEVSIANVTVSINGVYTPMIVDAQGNELKYPGLRANPQAVTVRVDIAQETQYKEVGVRPVVQGQPAPGYALQPLDVNPPTATIVGDTNELQAVNFVDTAPIDVSGISTTAVKTVPLSPPPQTLLLQSGQTVTVTVRVTALTIQQTVRVAPSVINLSGTVQLARPLDLVSVTVSGPAPALQQLALNPGDFKVVLDASGQGPGRHTLDTKVQQVPQGLTLIDASPKQVQVDLTPAPTPTPVPPPPPPSG